MDRLLAAQQRFPEAERLEDGGHFGCACGIAAHQQEDDVELAAPFHARPVTAPLQTLPDIVHAFHILEGGHLLDKWRKGRIGACATAEIESVSAILGGRWELIWTREEDSICGHAGFIMR